MKVSNYLKMYNWTIIKIIIVCEVKKTSRGRPSNIKTVCSDEKTLRWNHLRHFPKWLLVFWKYPLVDLKFRYLVTASVHIKLWLLNFLKLRCNVSYIGHWKTKVHIIGLQP